MTPDQRDQLLDLHRAAVVTQIEAEAGRGDWNDAHKAEDAFRAFLFSLDVTS